MLVLWTTIHDYKHIHYLYLLIGFYFHICEYENVLFKCVFQLLVFEVLSSNTLASTKSYKFNYLSICFILLLNLFWLRGGGALAIATVSSTLVVLSDSEHFSSKGIKINYCNKIKTKVQVTIINKENIAYKRYSFIFRLPLDNDLVVLRGCVLRNTEWCYGVVIFAGKDTKLMQNSGKTIFKRTSIDRLLNFIIVGVSIIGSLT